MDEIHNTDELLDRMKADEFEGATKLSPREYGLMRGLSPQLVYYHIRNGHITSEPCVCGRKVIDVKDADGFFKKGEHAE